jgi:uncharacterized protein with von Willebrand factor type A (vWA) domain
VTRYSLIAASILVALLLTGWQGFRFGVQHQAALTAVEALRIAEANAAIQKSLMRGIEKVAQDAENERKQVEADLILADDELERLRQTIRSADLRGNSGTTCVSDASTARKIVADCASRYKILAGKADKLRATVLGLQAYARTVSAPPPTKQEN